MLKKITNKYFNIPENFFQFQNKYLIIATLFGIGYAKKAPGTVASFVSFIIFYLLFLVSSSIVLIAVTFSIILGFIVCEKLYSKEDTDPQHIVIDEMAGQGIALLLVGNSLLLAFLSFLLFRLLDIKKPWIIGKSETAFSGGTAIMMDDILAGFFALLIIFFVSLFI